jgi:pilus assembly protein CpaC
MIGDIMNIVRFIAIGALAAGLNAPAFADGANGKTAKPRPAPTETLRVRAGGSGPHSQTISLGINKAIIVELPEDARDVLVSNPDVVDAVVRTPRQVYVVGMKAGPSNAFFFTASGKQLLNLEIHVQRDTVELKRLIERNIKGSEVQVETINDNVVINGSVKSASDAAAAREIAIRYVTDPDEPLKRDAVVNRVGIRGGDQVMVRVRVAEMQRTRTMTGETTRRQLQRLVQRRKQIPRRYRKLESVFAARPSAVVELVLRCG